MPRMAAPRTRRQFLSAKGITEVAGLKHLDRGYDDLEAKLSAAGAEVKRNIL